MDKKETYKELIAGLILVGIIAMLFWSITAFSSKTFQHIVLPILAIYIISAIPVMFIGTKIRNKVVKAITAVYTFPFSILYTVLLLSFPFFTLMVNWIFYFFFAYTTPYFLFAGLNKLHWIDFIRPQTITYLSITLAVFISVLLNQPLQFFVNLFTTRRHKKSKKLKALELDKLSNYTLSVDNVRFIVYAVYVIALLASNYSMLQGESLTSSIDTDRTILQSFVTFIAFDRAFTLMKQLKFKPSDLLEKIVASLKSKLESDQEILEQEKKNGRESGGATN